MGEVSILAGVCHSESPLYKNAEIIIVKMLIKTIYALVFGTGTYNCKIRYYFSVNKIQADRFRRNLQFKLAAIFVPNFRLGVWEAEA